MSVLFNNILQGMEWIEQNTDPRIKHMLFMGSIWPTATILFAYLYFVLKLGPELMRFRKPMNIDRIVLVYNAIQVLFSLYLVKEAFRLVWLRGDYRLFCIKVNENDANIAKQQLNTVWLFVMSKYLDLFDTIFFVLRKKQNQVTFLHVYHHSLVIILGWYLINFHPGGQVAFFGTINACVHVIMYGYYLLTVYNSEYKKAWWKKYLTLIQLIQFVVTGVHAFVTLFEPDCDFPRIVMILAITQDIFMFILFYDFYKKTYCNKKKSNQS